MKFELRIFREPLERTQGSLESDKSYWYFT